jgi:hypothetical protein
MGEFISRLQSEFQIEVHTTTKTIADDEGHIFQPKILVRRFPPAGKIKISVSIPNEERLTPSLVIFFCRKLRIKTEHFGIYLQ